MPRLPSPSFPGDHVADCNAHQLHLVAATREYANICWQLDQARSSCTKLVIENAKLSDKNGSLKIEITELQHSNHKLENGNATLWNDYRILRTTKLELERSIAGNEEIHLSEQQSLHDAVATLENLLANASTKVDAAQRDLIDLRSLNSQLVEENCAEKALLLNKEAALKAIQSAHNILQQEVAVVQAALAEARIATDTERQRADELSGDVDRWRKKAEMAEQIVKSLRIELATTAASSQGKDDMLEWERRNTAAVKKLLDGRLSREKQEKKVLSTSLPESRLPSNDCRMIWCRAMWFEPGSLDSQKRAMSVAALIDQRWIRSAAISLEARADLMEDALRGKTEEAVCSKIEIQSLKDAVKALVGNDERAERIDAAIKVLEGSLAVCSGPQGLYQLDDKAVQEPQHCGANSLRRKRSGEDSCVGIEGEPARKVVKMSSPTYVVSTGPSTDSEHVSTISASQAPPVVDVADPPSSSLTDATQPSPPTLAIVISAPPERNDQAEEGLLTPPGPPPAAVMITFPPPPPEASTPHRVSFALPSTPVSAKASHPRVITSPLQGSRRSSSMSTRAEVQTTASPNVHFQKSQPIQVAPTTPPPSAQCTRATRTNQRVRASPAAPSSTQDSPGRNEGEAAERRWSSSANVYGRRDSTCTAAGVSVDDLDRERRTSRRSPQLQFSHRGRWSRGS